MREPRRDHYLAPAAGDDTETVLDAAIEALGTRRALWPADAATRLHLLASLLAQADQHLPRAVADARDQRCSWAHIGDLVGVTPCQRPATPRRHHRPHTRPRAKPDQKRRGWRQAKGMR